MGFVKLELRLENGILKKKKSDMDNIKIKQPLLYKVMSHDITEQIDKNHRNPMHESSGLNSSQRKSKFERVMRNSARNSLSEVPKYTFIALVNLDLLFLEHIRRRRRNYQRGIGLFSSKTFTIRILGTQLVFFTSSQKLKTFIKKFGKL
jgi:hypothetical protein